MMAGFPVLYLILIRQLTNAYWSKIYGTKKIIFLV